MAVTKKKASTPSWMKTGNAAKAEVQKEEAKAAQAKEEAGKPRRFWMPNDSETSITFLDGELDDDGALNVPMIREHQLYLHGHYRNWFVCTQDEEPCPICEGGDKPNLIALFTVIDHSEFTAQNGVTYKDQIRVYAVKRNSLNMLQKYATKRKGLAGCTFEVSRTGDKSAAVGNVFDFDTKRTMEELKEAYPNTEIKPLDWENTITYLDATELRKMGFGTSPMGSESAPSEHSEDGVDASDEL